MDESAWELVAPTGVTELPCRVAESSGKLMEQAEPSDTATTASAIERTAFINDLPGLTPGKYMEEGRSTAV
jgi:hypothetical protein